MGRESAEEVGPPLCAQHREPGQAAPPFLSCAAREGMEQLSGPAVKLRQARAVSGPDVGWMTEAWWWCIPLRARV